MSLVVLQRIFSEDVMLRHRLQVSLFLSLVGHLLLLAVFAVAVGQSFQPISMQQEMVVTLQTEPAEQALIEPVEEPMSYLTSDQARDIVPTSCEHNFQIWVLISTMPLAHNTRPTGPPLSAEKVSFNYRV